MRVSLSYPSLSVGIPQGSRQYKAVWTLARLELDVPEYGHSDIQAAIEWSQADDDQLRHTIYRVGENHLSKVATPFHVRDRGERDAIAQNPARFILDRAINAAVEWRAANIGVELKEHPFDLRQPTAAASLDHIIGSLPASDQLHLQNEDGEIQERFRSHMEAFFSSLAIIDGKLYCNCAEPVYVVHGFPGGTLIRVETDAWDGRDHTGIFPIGRINEARDFAIATTLEGEAYTENLRGLVDCGEALNSDTEYRSVMLAAREACSHYLRRYSISWGNTPSASNILSLINDVPISSIMIYRKLSSFVADHHLNRDVNPDDVSEALREAAADPLAHVFTADGRLPLAAIADLWDNRGVSVSFGGPRQKP